MTDLLRGAALAPCLCRWSGGIDYLGPRELYVPAQFRCECPGADDVARFIGSEWIS